MKLATLKNGTRDGRLAVVSRDLTRYTDASFLAPTLQAALDDWQRLSPHLAALSESLEHGAVPSARFHEHDAHSPLPRAYQWADGSAYVNHVELVRKSRGSEMPAKLLDRSADLPGRLGFLPRRRAIRSSWPTKPGASTSRARSPSSSATCRWARALPMQARAGSGWSCWSTTSACAALAPAELAKGFGFFQSKPSSAFSPVAVTPDELGDAWDGGKLSLPLNVDSTASRSAAPMPAST